LVAEHQQPHKKVAVEMEPLQQQMELRQPQIPGVVEAVRQVQGLETVATAALVSLSSKSHLRTMPHSHLV
jgi:hypothetical protein